MFQDALCQLANVQAITSSAAGTVVFDVTGVVQRRANAAIDSPPPTVRISWAFDHVSS